MSQTGMAFDLSGFLANAEKADKKLQDMVAHSRQLKENLDSALSSASATSFLDVMGRLSNTMDGLNRKKVTDLFDVKKAEEAYSVVDRVVTVIKTLSQQKGAVLFDTQSMYATNQGVMQLEERFKSINKEMSRVRKEWSELSTFKAPINTRTGKEYKPESKTYQIAEANYRAEREAQMRLLIEKKAIATQELNWAKMTQDEKLAYIEKALRQELAVEQRKVNEIRKEYKKLVKDQLDITKKNDSLKKSNIGGAGVPMQREYERQFLDLDARRRSLEAQYGQFVVDIAKDAQRQVLDLEVKRIQSRQAAEKAAQEQQWQKYLSSPEGALTLAKDAKTINEMKEAQKYLVAARNNTNVSDKKTIDDLNQAYQRLRVQIEQLSIAENNEKTLQPTIRNEYTRMLKELDKLTAAKKKASETQAYKSGDAAAMRNYADIEARERDVRNKILEIEKNSQGMLDEIKRQHRANNAMLEVAETQKVEQQKAEIARKRYEQQVAEAKKLETWSSQKIGGVIGQTTNAANIAQQEAAIKKLTEARRHLDQNDAKYEATLKKLNTEIKRHEHALKMATDANYRKNQVEKSATNPQNALAYARSLESGVKTINSMNLALQRLRNAQKGLDLNTKQGVKTYKEIEKEIKKIERALGKVNTKNKGVMDTAGQLKRAFAAVFSVSAIRGYMNKLIEVRGEFEMQHRSLQVLLQNREKADELWNKTVSLAVKSPFTTKELVTYTKQLAAYRIEHDKLYETNKMLADVSSGLGVDMGRLILAFGQVKAANFLRGTELRQFSEAGVNLLDELAQKFTEVEGRTVSVGEVFERVSKRMVTFKDVEDVFKKITSEGGMFYQMQEKQSETLKGQLLNLRDSYELMLNQIGKSHEGTIKKFIKVLRALIDNWRTLAPIIETVGTALAFAFATKGIIAFIKYLKAAYIAIQGLFTASTTAAAVNPFVAIAAAAGLLIGAYSSAKNYMSEFESEMLDVERSIEKSLTEQIFAYRKLADAINDARKTEEERIELQKELESKFDDVLPRMYTEMDYIRQYANNYEDAEAAMRSYYNALATEQKKQRVGQLTDDKLYGSIIPNLTTAIAEDLDNADNLNDYEKSLARGAVAQVLDAVVKDFRSGANLDVIDNFFEKLSNIVGKKITEEDISSITFHPKNWIAGEGDAPSRDYIQYFGEFMQALIDEYRGKAAANGLNFATLEEKEDYLNLQAAKMRTEKLLAEYDNWVQESLKANKMLDGKWKSVMEVAFGAEKAESIFSSNVSFRLNENELLRAARKYIAANAEYGAKQANTFTTSVENYLESFVNEIKPTSKTKQGIKAAFAKVINSYGGAKGVVGEMLTSMIPDDTKTRAEVIDAISNKIDVLTASLEAYRVAVAAGTPNALNLFGFGEEDVPKMEKQIEALDLTRRLLGYVAKSGAGGGNKALQKLKDQISFIRQLADDYAELWKKYGEEEARRKIWSEARKSEAEDLGFDWSSLKIGGRAEEKLNLQSLMQSAIGIEGGRLEVNKAIADVEVEIDWEVKEKNNLDFTRSLEEMFDDYELSLELKKLNIPATAMKSLFGVEPIELPQLRASVLTAAGINEDLQKKSDQDILDSDFYKSLNEHQQNEIRERLEEISEMELKLQQENLKKYIEFARGAISERAKIKLEELNKIAEINKAFEIKNDDTGEQREAKERYKAAALEQASKEATDALQKLDWEAFRSGESFNMIFDDLEHAGDKALNSVIERLKEFKEEWKDMPFAQMKQVNDLLQKAEEAMSATDNPFKEAKRLRRATQADGRSMQDAQASLFNAEAEVLKIDSLMAKLEVFGQVRDGLREESALSEDDLALYQQFKENQSDFVTSITEGLLNEEELRSSINVGLASGADLMEVVTEQLQKQKSAQQDVATSAKTQVTNLKKLPGEYKKQAEVLSQINDKAKELYDAFMDLATNAFALFGKELDENAKVFAEMGASMMDTIMNTIVLQLQLKAATAGAMAFGTALNTAMGIIGWIVMGVQLLSQAFGAIVQAHDNDLQEQIEKEEKAVRQLEKAYEDLETAIKNAYDIDIMGKSQNMAIANLEEQIRRTEKMIQLEKDKKKTDKSVVENLEEEVEELKKAKKELEENFIEARGGFGSDENVKSAAEAFVDAWLQAYKETGDGLDGLNDKFDEYYEEFIKKQLLLQGTSKYLDVFFNKFDAQIAGIGKTTDAATVAKNIGELWKETSGDLDAFLTGLAEALNIAETLGDHDLSGLQAGISGITEDQADVLAAYWSNVSLYTYDTNQKVNDLVSKLFSSDTTVNPMLSQLQTIATNTANIHGLIDELMANGTNRFIKVKMIG